MPESATANSEHYFPPGESIARRIHEERAVGLLYGPRAVILGAIEPLTYTATMLGTRYADRPFRRLARTAKIQETVLLGTRDEADEALRRVDRLHQGVEGWLEEPVGRHPAGTHYSALDQELMLWTLAVIADSARAAYETMIQPLSELELDLLWGDYMRFGELFGMSREAMPGSYREFSIWLQQRLDSPDSRPTEHGLEVAPVLAFDIPTQFMRRPLRKLSNLLVKGTLSERTREVFEIRWTPLHQAGFLASAFLGRLVIRVLPSKLRRGRNDPVFANVARLEARRGGTPLPDPTVTSSGAASSSSA